MSGECTHSTKVHQRTTSVLPLMCGECISSVLTSINPSTRKDFERLAVTTLGNKDHLLALGRSILGIAFYKNSYGRNIYNRPNGCVREEEWGTELRLYLATEAPWWGLQWSNVKMGRDGHSSEGFRHLDGRKNIDEKEVRKIHSSQVFRQRDGGCCGSTWNRDRWVF